MRNTIVCNTKAAATAALETIACTFPRGTQRDALLAVIVWIEENYPKDFDEATQERIKRIYDEVFDDAGRKASKWAVHGGKPEHGTRAMVAYLFNSKTKTWELENKMPPIWTKPNPNILEKTESNEGKEW